MTTIPPEAGAGAERTNAAAPNDRRADWLEVLELLLVLIAAAAYVYVIGWVITWVRLATARLPVDATLPIISGGDDFLAGLRLVIAMAIVFGAMCAVAWGAHLWTWKHRAPEWHEVIRHGRVKVAREHHRVFRRGTVKEALSFSSEPPAGMAHTPVGDTYVRIIAGFNVGVLGATIGLAAARVLKTPIDQLWPPGPWWDLLAPWALVTAGATLVFAWLGPLFGHRLTHNLLWVAVVFMALVSEAPIGLLLLTWAGVATLGRAYGKARTRRGQGVVASNHPRHLSFVLSPLPWILLTIYALIGVAYYGQPPVTFSQSILTTSSGLRTGGFIARSGGDVYLASCSPLADGTSTSELVSAVPAASIKSMTTGSTPFIVDSGQRPSLPTVILRALGIEASSPTWIRAEVRPTRATCAGDPLPASSVGYPAPRLGVGVIAGPAPPGRRALYGEPPIGQTSPGIAALARRFQPTLLVTVADPFWPVSVGALLADRGAGGQLTCLQHLPADPCPVAAAKPRGAPTIADLRGPSGPNDFLQYPSSPALTSEPGSQLAAFLRGEPGAPAVLPTLDQRLANPGLVDPWLTAQIYFYDAQNTNPATWPARDPAIKGKFIALQYWFLYAYNYYPTVVDASLMNASPVAADLINTDLHQGDWEHITVLLDARTKRPLWVYMARHANEGQYFPWNSPQLTFDHGHVVIQAAFGGHPSYPAGCRENLRENPSLPNLVRGHVADWTICGSGRYAFRWQTTPLVDIAKTPWACWQGHFGVARPSEIVNALAGEGSVQRAIDANYFVAGPRSPLWQAENGRLAADETPVQGRPAPADRGACVSAAH